MKMAITGIRGIPANYGGFETLTEETFTKEHDSTGYKVRFIEKNYTKIVVSLLLLYLFFSCFYMFLAGINEDEGIIFEKV